MVFAKKGLTNQRERLKAGQPTNCLVKTFSKHKQILECLFILFFSSECVAQEVQTLRCLLSPVGSLEFASIHESGHVVAAFGSGIKVRQAVVFQVSRPGFGFYWKGATTLAGKPSRGMAVIKLGGTVAEHFVDGSGRFRTPSLYDVITSRGLISSSDKLTQADLGADDLLSAQQKAYRMLISSKDRLRAIYGQLLTQRRYP